MSPPVDTPYECIEPRVGDQLWRLEAPGTDATLRSQLEAHVAVCQACRLLLDLDAKSRELSRSGALGRDGSGTPSWLSLRRWLRPPVLAAAALAAATLAALIMPPRPVDRGGLARGEDVVRFLRPVEGEVVTPGQRTLSWTPVDGATRYRVELRDGLGKRVWSGESAGTSVSLPGSVPLDAGTRYRALLGTQPTDLLPPGGTSVAFRVGSPWRAALHRLRWASPILQGVSIVAAGLLIVFALFRRSP
jgi:hypothetical protein